MKPIPERVDEFKHSFACLFCWWSFGVAFGMGFLTIGKITELLWK